MVKQYEVLKWASSFLKKYNREEKVAQILLQHHLNVSNHRFFLMMHERIDEHTIEQFKKDIKRHALTGIPYQHLIGYEYFYGRKFYVNEHVLIPRVETEELIYHIINNYKNQQEHLTIVDVGTGSGIIAITLALELPNVTVYATDISEKALKVAIKNAKKHRVSIHFFQTNFLEAILKEQINPHLIVSNPPYIRYSDESLLSDTVKYDPHIALFARLNGLEAYRAILNQSQTCSSRLNEFYFEIGHDQGKEVKQLIETYYPQSNNKIIKDINDHDRIVYSKL